MTAAKLLFWVFASAACGGAVGVVLAQKVSRMAIWLVISLGSVSGLFFLLHADFVAATQLLIYVGGTLVLLIFGIMLTSGGPDKFVRTSPAEGFLAAGIGVLFLAMIFSTVTRVDWPTSPPRAESAEGNTARPIGLALLGLRPDKDLDPTSGRLSPGYLLPFEIVSVHLLVVLIGAAYLARAKQRVDSTEESERDA